MGRRLAGALAALVALSIPLAPEGCGAFLSIPDAFLVTEAGAEDGVPGDDSPSGEDGVNEGGFDGGDAQQPGDGSDAQPPADGGDGQPPGDGSTDCPAAARLVYAMGGTGLDTYADVYALDPTAASPAFSKVGRADCEGGGGSPLSIAVSRDGFMWLYYDYDGALFKVDLSHPPFTPCTSLNVISGRLSDSFALTFAVDNANGHKETLFAAGSFGLATLSGPSPYAMKSVGPMTGLDVSQGVELAGRSDGALFALAYSSSGWVLAGIDKTTSNAGGLTPDAGTPVVLSSIPLNSDAFGLWSAGGSFYIHTLHANPDSTVWQYNPSDGSVKQAIPDVGFQITVAAASTCVP